MFRKSMRFLEKYSIIKDRRKNMDIQIQVTLLGTDISSYPIFVKRPSECSNYAASELVKYLLKTTGEGLSTTFVEPTTAAIVLDYGDEIQDGFRIYFKNGSLFIYGNNARSVLYGAYEFLEKIGWRFFSAQSAYRGVDKGLHMYPCEKLLAKGDVAFEEDFKVEQKAVIYYRDGSAYTVKDADFCAKVRLNAETWDSKEIPAQFGGARKFAGSHGHTFKDLLPIGKYGKEHPEFFAEIDGERRTEGSDWWNVPQWCMTNFDSVPYVVEEMKKKMERLPTAEYISVSQNDNNLFCQCEKCKKSYAEVGYFGTLVNFVSKVAEAFEPFYPNVKVHTYVYTGTDDINDKVVAHKNVMAQWCPVKVCRNHALSDPSCPVNSVWYKKLKTLSKVFKEIFIYDYRHCLKYAMLTFTDLFTLRETMRAYAECHVTGIYSELCIHTLKQPSLEELRSYLYGKLTWNPYMSDEEYNRHINEFLEGYYGEGWRYVREVIDKWSAINPKMHYSSFQGVMITDECKYDRYENGDYRFVDFMPKEQVVPFCNWVYETLDKAKEGGDRGHQERIEVIRSSFIWYELFHTMKNVMENGTEEEKTAMTARCKNLCSRMRKHMMKYTIYIGMSNITYMFDDFSMPVSDWHYVGNIAGDDAL